MSSGSAGDDALSDKGEALAAPSISRNKRQEELA